MTLTVKQQTILLLLAWIIVQSILYVRFGVDASLESLKYIGAANDLIDKGQLPETRYFFYLSTTLLIAFCIKTGLGYGGVVVIQLLLNLFATFSFYRSLRLVQQKSLSAFLTVLLLISFLPYQGWNFFLYTESVFYSSALLFFSSCIRFSQLKKKAIWTQAFFLLLTIVSRPLGIIFLPCWILFLAFKKKIKPIVIGATLLLGIIIAVIVVNTILSTIGDWHALRPAEFGYIICDIPTRDKLALDHLKQYSPFTQIGLFVLQHPGEFIRLSVTRLEAFYLLKRGYYSTPHNLYLLFYAMVFALPLLYTIVMRKKIVAKGLFAFSLFIITGFTLAVVLQCDDYHNRFHHTIVPVFLFGGVFLLLETFRSLNSPKK